MILALLDYWSSVETYVQWTGDASLTLSDFYNNTQIMGWWVALPYSPEANAPRAFKIIPRMRAPQHTIARHRLLDTICCGACTQPLIISVRNSVTVPCDW